MDHREVNLGNIDEVIARLKDNYELLGIAGVVDWAERTFQPETTIVIARNLTDLSKIDTRVVYDRAILQLDGAGQETAVYYLQPINQEAFSSDLFLSVRLHFVEQPFELLVYVK